MEGKKLSETLLENLRNIVDVEEESKEVVKPDFAAAVREIKDNDEKRDEANEKVEAPKEGEEALPKDIKLVLDESLFEDDVNREESISLEQYLDEINEVGGWVTLEKIEMDVFHTPVDASAADVINYAVHHGWKIFDHPEHGLAIMHERLEGKKLPESLEDNDLEESAELLTRIKGEVEEDIKPDMTIRSAYAIVEPDEYQLDHLRDDITIEEVWKKMQEGEEIYEIASVDGKGFDSAVREGIFVLIERALGVPYKKVYETWLDVRPMRKRNVIEGIKRKK